MKAVILYFGGDYILADAERGVGCFSAKDVRFLAH